MRSCAVVSAAALALAAAAGCSSAALPKAPEPANTAARLQIEAPPGASVHVDGIFVGQAPLPDAIDADPGRHLIAVTQTGHVPEARQVLVARGKLEKVSVELEDTVQRSAAWVIIVSAAPVLATGIVFGVLAVVEQRAGDDVLDEAADEDALTEDEQRRFDEHAAARDDYRIVSGVAGGVGLGLFLVGGLLFAFDDPELPKRPISVLPMVGPRSVGAVTTFRF